MNYYRVYTGFTEYIPIDSTEMEKAMHAFITGSPVVFENGATSRIDRILPDFHRAMGWNPSHRLDTDDQNQLRSTGTEGRYWSAIGKAKEKIQYLLETKQEHLIGKNVPMSKLMPAQDPRVKKLTAETASKMRLN
jgi:hypothetical protein